jgi:indole-3-glycerol phosphate synthase
MNILDTIIAQKKIEVGERKQSISIAELQRMNFFARETMSLKKFLLDADKTGIIAEFKRRSPSKGIINATADLRAITASYAINGASGISVLTDQVFFGGTMDDLLEARVNKVPLLRKDFMIDEYQLIEAKAFGADVILLIAACLTVSEVKKMASMATSLGLEVLLEIHNEDELDHICDEVTLVGVNNRNLKTFEVDIETSLKLINRIPKTKPAIAESGISDVDTIVTLHNAGFRGFLIGENFMKQANPAVAFTGFVHDLRIALKVVTE